MAIYRPPKRRWPALVALLVLGVALGLGAGLLIASRAPDPAEAVAPAKRALSQAAVVLDVLEVEYSEAVSGGSVQSRSEYEGSLSALERSRDAFEEARPALEALAPQRAADIDDAYERLRELMEDEADPAEVSGAVAELEGELRGDQ